MTRLARLVSAAGAALLIAACGGGGGDGGGATAADPIDKYIGSWAACIVVGTLSGQAILAYAKKDTHSASFDLTATLHGNTNCTSPLPGSTVPLDSGTLVIDGTATVESKTVDIVTFNSAPSGVSAKDIAFIDGKELRGGDELSPPDAQGYPTALDTGIALTRQ